MRNFLLLQGFEKKIDLVAISKIIIIVLMSIFLVGFFNPFYEYPNNAKLYGYQSIVIANGNYEYENELLQDTGFWEFVPTPLVKTQHNTAIPDILPLFPIIGAFFYKMFGLSGLFYLNPIFTISGFSLIYFISSIIFP